MGENLSDELLDELTHTISNWNLIGYSPAFMIAMNFKYDEASQQLIATKINTQDVASPVPIKTPYIRLPYVRAKGVFKYKCTISKEGHVTDVEILETPHKVLNRFYIKGLKKWIFAPATEDGEPIESTFHGEQPIDLLGPDLDRLKQLELP
jgi:hypothetical protein